MGQTSFLTLYRDAIDLGRTLRAGHDQPELLKRSTAVKIGVPKEIKVHENRVGLVPASVRELVHGGHAVLIERGAGLGAGISDADFKAAGAELADTPAEIFATTDMVVKVKEPQAEERKQLRPDQILFTYLHLAPDPAQTKDLLASGATCIAYETVTASDGTLPLLTPMSEVAGRMAIQVGARCLESASGGRGILLGGVPGVDSAEVVILGAGVAGSNAAAMAIGLGARVTLVDRSLPALRRAVDHFGTSVRTVYSTRDAIDELLRQADLVIGTVLIPGARAPKLITRQSLTSMKPGSAIVDVAIDQGGCTETSRPTTHADPTYTVDGVIHYCVANMPGGVARTSTFALNNATLPFIVSIADKGWKRAIADDIHLRRGLNIHSGRVTYEAVATALGLEFTTPEAILAL
jgi:alanine dehydrogenase